jgi:hypothetical protein
MIWIIFLGFIGIFLYSIFFLSYWDIFTGKYTIGKLKLEVFTSMSLVSLLGVFLAKIGVNSFSLYFIFVFLLAFRIMTVITTKFNIEEK